MMSRLLLALLAIAAVTFCVIGARAEGSSSSWSSDAVSEQFVKECATNDPTVRAYADSMQPNINTNARNFNENVIYPLCSCKQKQYQQLFPDGPPAKQDVSSDQERAVLHRCSTEVLDSENNCLSYIALPSLGLTRMTEVCSCRSKAIAGTQLTSIYDMKALKDIELKCHEPVIKTACTESDMLGLNETNITLTQAGCLCYTEKRTEELKKAGLAPNRELPATVNYQILFYCKTHAEDYKLSLATTTVPPQGNENQTPSGAFSSQPPVSESDQQKKLADGNSSGLGIGIIVVIVVSSVLFVALAVCFGWCCIRRRRQKGQHSSLDGNKDQLGISLLPMADTHATIADQRRSSLPKRIVVLPPAVDYTGRFTDEESGAEGRSRGEGGAGTGDDSSSSEARRTHASTFITRLSSIFMPAADTSSNGSFGPSGNSFGPNNNSFGPNSNSFGPNNAGNNTNNSFGPSFPASNGSNSFGPRGSSSATKVTSSSLSGGDASIYSQNHSVHSMNDTRSSVIGILASGSGRTSGTTSGRASRPRHESETSIAAVRSTMASEGERISFQVPPSKNS